MTIRLVRFGLACLTGLVAAAACLVDVGAQAPQVLGALTVPAAKLPAGCALQPLEKSRTMMLPDGKVLVTSNAGQPPSNPWTGTDNALRMAARGVVEGASRSPLLPDGPPTSREGLAAWTAKGLAHIAEGYQADYSTEAKERVRVSAVRYGDAKQATSPEPGLLVLGSLGLGSTVVRVTGDSTSACYRAIWNHMESLR